RVASADSVYRGRPAHPAVHADHVEASHPQGRVPRRLIQAPDNRVSSWSVFRSRPFRPREAEPTLRRHPLLPSGARQDWHTRRLSARGSAAGLPCPPSDRSCCAGRAPTSAAWPSVVHDGGKCVSSGGSSPTLEIVPHRRTSSAPPTSARLSAEGSRV